MPQQIELRNIALQAAQPLVHGVSLTLQRGRVLALVGGSGSGKSLTCAATLGILPAGVRQTAGEILADGKPVSPCALRGIKIATIMQNPRSAFNPLHTMHTHARETCLALGKPADDATLTAAIEAVGLEKRRARAEALPVRDERRHVAAHDDCDGGAVRITVYHRR
ncbi:Nickel transport ATP-binding protein NikD (TC 3.A.1.5.3) [Escherichia coli ISC41]|nr:Nickel transport ATP-binding protein NikD (TC 3.A.1.5.3) [Escherichia coli ISC41]